jgi:hypothetical protein
MEKEKKKGQYYEVLLCYKCMGEHGKVINVKHELQLLAHLSNSYVKIL